jgi:Zn-dependent M28 family amino/carboxypeptidase
VGAHYDHIPEGLGAAANGVSGALELARGLASAPSRLRTLTVGAAAETLGVPG